MPRSAPLPPAPEDAPHGLAARARHVLLRRWSGRVLLASLAVWLAAQAGAAVPCGLDVLAAVALWLYVAWALVRLAAWLTRKLLWRIRTKLLVSYLFIAVVPLVLLTALFGLAGVLFSGLVASHLAVADLERTVQRQRGTAEAALADLPAGEAAARASLESRLAPWLAEHPDGAWALWRGGRAVAAAPGAPAALPSWVPAAGYAGVTRESKEDDAAHVRTVVRRGDDALLLQVPVGERLFVDLEQRLGLRYVASGGTVQRDARGVRVRLDDRHREAVRQGDDQLSGIFFPALGPARQWSDGTSELVPMLIHFEPHVLVRRLSPGSLNVGDFLVKALAAVAAAFLLFYSVALVLGLMLARSVTKSVHELHRGTERLRQRDLHHRIRVHSRDQLGELAESFNVMAGSMQGLLMEQAEKQRLEEELRIARQIQMSLLPQEAVSLPGLRVSALCLPAAEVGGDYYDLLPLSPDRMGVLVADVSGKGTSAALYMAELKGLVLSLSRIHESPQKLLAEANRILAANMDARSFITMAYAVVDTSRRTMRYARAGHNAIIHLEAASGRTRVLCPAGLGLGIDPGPRFEQVLEEAEVPLQPGDLFLFFTDGLSEAMNERAELFGERRLRDVLERTDGAGHDEARLKDRILAEIQDFVGEAAQHDDMTLVILKVV